MTTGTATTALTTEQRLSHVVVRLLRGVLYRETHPQLWRDLAAVRAAVTDHLGVLGLEVIVDDAEGYAYVRSRPTDEDDDLPRLVPRRRLSFHVSLLLALLRKRLAELDARSGDTRLVLTREQIVEMLRIYLPDAGTEVRLVQQIDSYLRKAIDLGFLARSRTNDREFEVRRILKAYIDGQWLSDFDAHLAGYLAELTGDSDENYTGQDGADEYTGVDPGVKSDRNEAGTRR